MKYIAFLFVTLSVGYGAEAYLLKSDELKPCAIDIMKGIGATDEQVKTETANPKFAKIIKNYLYISEKDECEALNKHLDVRIAVLKSQFSDEQVPRIFKKYLELKSGGGQIMDLKYLVILGRIADDIFEVIDVPLSKDENIMSRPILKSDF